jgi:hypothetical protein
MNAFLITRKKVRKGTLFLQAAAWNISRISKISKHPASLNASLHRQKHKPVKTALRCLVFRIIIRAQEHFEAPPVICSQLYFDVNLLKREKISVTIVVLCRKLYYEVLSKFSCKRMVLIA